MIDVLVAVFAYIGIGMCHAMGIDIAVPGKNNLWQLTVSTLLWPVFVAVMLFAKLYRD